MLLPCLHLSPWEYPPSHRARTVNASRTEDCGPVCSSGGDGTPQLLQSHLVGRPTWEDLQENRGLGYGGLWSRVSTTSSRGKAQRVQESTHSAILPNRLMVTRQNLWGHTHLIHFVILSDLFCLSGTWPLHFQRRPKGSYLSPSSELFPNRPQEVGVRICSRQDSPTVKNCQDCFSMIGLPTQDWPEPRPQRMQQGAKGAPQALSEVGGGHSNHGPNRAIQLEVTSQVSRFLVSIAS